MLLIIVAHTMTNSQHAFFTNLQNDRSNRRENFKDTYLV